MFLADQVIVHADLDAARAGLARLAASGALSGSAQDAYGGTTAGIAAQVGVAGISRLVRVQACELPSSPDSAGLAIRWEAAGSGSGVFPVLDADLRLSPAGEQLTLLTLTGSYRPPFGRAGAAVDRAVMHRAATATVRNFLASMAAVLTRQVTESSPSSSNSAPACPSGLIGP
jgi:hypothetical protein